jgi:hypothetical protein
MNDRELIERLAAEIEKATATGDSVRARKLADLQLAALAQLTRDMVAEPAPDPVAAPQPRLVR